jgi:HD-GYP domain-containing protein (c-di-GMP phosphodiesterase class II)
MKKFISVAFCTLMLLSATVEAQKLETIAFQQDKISFYFFQNFQEFISETGLNEQLNNELNSLFDDQVLDPQKEFESLFSDIYDNISTIKGSAEVEFAYPDSDDEKTGEAIAQTFYEQAYKKFEEGQASLVVGLNKAGVLQLFCFISQDIACSNLLHVAHNLLIPELK